jgi:ribosomal protein S18
MADLRVDIAAEFVGKKAFKDADNAAVRLDKTIKKLGRTLGVTLGASAIIAYSKASVKAFSDDEAAARRLSSAVDNLGLSFSKVQVATFISDLERTASIADDVLRPAFQSLLNITGSLTKSQELLNNAIQISRASGVDLATVTNDLGKGYVGITRGLIKYNTGLTRAELQTKGFNEILGIMLAKSAGAAQDYLTTTSFKMDTLALASENAKETIGKGLVDAFARIGGGTEAKDAAKAIDNIAKAVNGVTLVLGTAIGLLNKFRQGYTNFLMDPLGTGMGGAGASSTNRSASPAGTAVRLRQQREAEAAAVKRAKEVANLTKKQVASTKALTAEQKKQASLKKSGTVFDLEQIQIVAALKGQVTKEEEIRLQAQLALLNGNADLAKKLTDQILMAQDSSGNLAKFLAALPNARNPFEYLDAYLSYLAGKAAAISVGTPFGQAAPSLNAAPAPVPATNVPTNPSDGMITYNTRTGLNYNPNANNVVVELKITGEGDVTNAIAKGLQNQSLSTGDSAYINRRTGGFAG